MLIESVTFIRYPIFPANCSLFGVLGERDNTFVTLFASSDIVLIEISIKSCVLNWCALSVQMSVTLKVWLTLLALLPSTDF